MKIKASIDDHQVEIEIPDLKVTDFKNRFLKPADQIRYQRDVAVESCVAQVATHFDYVKKELLEGYYKKKLQELANKNFENVKKSMEDEH